MIIRQWFKLFKTPFCVFNSVQRPNGLFAFAPAAFVEKVGITFVYVSAVQQQDAAHVECCRGAVHRAGKPLFHEIRRVAEWSMCAWDKSTADIAGGFSPSFRFKSSVSLPIPWYMP